MQMRLLARVLILTAATIGALSVTSTRHAAAATLTEACVKAMSSATIDDANRVSVVTPGPPGQKPPPPDDLKAVSLGDIIKVEGVGLAEFMSRCDPLPIVLYLNGYPIKSLKPYPPTPPSGNALQFILNVTDGSRSSWTPILESPCCSERPITVSVGLEDQYPLPPTQGKQLPVLKLDVLANRWFALWGLVFVAMLIIFFCFVLKSNIIRDGNPAAAGAAGVLGTYSLSKSQGAWWFFIILAAYLLIGLVTGDFSTSINSTALILLGIGAGTVVGAAVIDAAKQTQDAADADARSTMGMKAKIDALKSEIEGLDSQLKTAPAPSNANELAASLKKKKDEYKQMLSFYCKLTGQHEDFLTDILSDANGISFHRFQMAAWTLVLGILFVKEVYENLAMPTFNTTLMGLLGLSAATYLGLKIPEATTPKK